MEKIAVQLDIATFYEFDTIAKLKHQTKSELLKELINCYLSKKRKSLYLQAIKNIAEDEKQNHNDYADIYEFRQDW